MSSAGGPDPNRPANAFMSGFAGCLGVAAAIVLALVALWVILLLSR